MQTLEQRFEALASWLGMIDTFTLIIMLFAFVGIMYDVLTKKKRMYREAGTNVLIGIGNGLLSLTAYGLIFIVTLWLVEQVVLWHIPINVYTWILAVMAADFSYYWMHRIEHKVRFLWAIHSVHHSSKEFDLTTGLRLAWVEGLFEWAFFVPMVLLGFDVVQVTMGIIVVVAYQTWIHTEHIGKLGYLDKIINTPSVHRVHHGSNVKYIDKNFGGILMLWDKLFGTYQAEEEKVMYGLLQNIDTSNPISINLYEWKEMFKDIRKAKSFKDKWKYILKPPGWSPSTI